jgi:hypothetical protein
MECLVAHLIRPNRFVKTPSLLDGVYNSFLPLLDPCAIGGKDLENVAQRAGLAMEEVLRWFEDEKSRRTKRLSCQFVQPQQPAQQLPMSPAATTNFWTQQNSGLEHI